MSKQSILQRRKLLLTIGITIVIGLISLSLHRSFTRHQERQQQREHNRRYKPRDLDLLVVAGSAKPEIIAETKRLVTSVLLHASCPIHFHVVTGDGSANELHDFFDELYFHNVHRSRMFSYEFKDLDREWAREEVSDLELNHHSSIYGYAKLLLHKIWPEVRTALYLDTDIIVTHDPCPYFLNLKKQMIEEKRSFAMAYRFDNATSMYPHFKYKCSGTMFFNFDRIRKHGLFDSVLRDVYKSLYPEGMPSKELKGRKRHFLTGGDQDYFWMLTKKKRRHVLPISMSWSLEFCHDWHDFIIPTRQNTTKQLDSFGNEMFMGALHLNCLGFNDRPQLHEKYPEFQRIIDFYSVMDPFILSEMIKNT
ncbi:hypothetical protein RCL1_003237 [Eukaryota sp. TZLM3-RCL]